MVVAYTSSLPTIHIEKIIRFFQYKFEIHIYFQNFFFRIFPKEGHEQMFHASNEIPTLVISSN